MKADCSCDLERGGCRRELRGVVRATMSDGSEVAVALAYGWGSLFEEMARGGADLEVETIPAVPWWWSWTVPIARALQEEDLKRALHALDDRPVIIPEAVLKPETAGELERVGHLATAPRYGKRAGSILAALTAAAGAPLPLPAPREEVYLVGPTLTERRHSRERERADREPRQKDHEKRARGARRRRRRGY